MARVYEDETARQLPSSIIAEQSLLGCIIIDPQTLSEVASTIFEDDFYLEDHAHIYAAMKRLFNENHEIDAVTLIDTLVKNGVYDKEHSQDYILTLSEIVPNSMNIKDYARIIKEKSTLRQLINAAGKISDDAFSEHDSVTNILDSAQSRLYEIAQGRDVRGMRHIRDILNIVFDNLSILKQDKNAFQGVMTGFSGLDSVLSGMGKSDLVIIGARPAMGKTSFALGIAANVAASTGKKVCIFSLEMSAEQVVTRMLSTEAMVDSYRFRTGDISNEDFKKIGVAATKLAGCEILIDDSTESTVTGIRAKLRREMNKIGKDGKRGELGLVVIDYLGLMQSDKRTDSRVNEMGDISRSLKILAKDFNVPVVCLSQLSRKPEGRTSQKPMLSDLRESGAIEQDADMVLFLYREDYYKEEIDKESDSLICEVVVAKNRHGGLGTVKLGWLPKYTKFRTIVDEQNPNMPV